MRRKNFIPNGDGLEERVVLSPTGPVVTTTTTTTNWTATNGHSMSTVVVETDEPFYTTGTVAPYGTVAFWSDLNDVDTKVKDLTANTATEQNVATQPTIFSAGYTDGSGTVISIVGEFNPITTVDYNWTGSLRTTVSNTSQTNTPGSMAWVDVPGQTQPGDPEPVSPTVPSGGTDPTPPPGNGDPPSDSPSVPGGPKLPSSGSIYLYTSETLTNGHTDDYYFSGDYTT